MFMCVKYTWFCAILMKEKPVSNTILFCTDNISIIAIKKPLGNCNCAVVHNKEGFTRWIQKWRWKFRTKATSRNFEIIIFPFCSNISKALQQKQFSKDVENNLFASKEKKCHLIKSREKSTWKLHDTEIGWFIHFSRSTTTNFTMAPEQKKKFLYVLRFLLITWFLGKWFTFQESIIKLLYCSFNQCLRW